MITYSECVVSVLWLVLGLGLVALFLGGDWLCCGAASLARKMNISPAVVGLTVVAYMTSLPEFLTSLYAVNQGSPGIALGNIVGSNIVNVTCIIGLAVLVCPINIHLRLIRREMPILMVVTAFFWLLCYSGQLEPWHGFILLGGFVAYIGFMLWGLKREDREVLEVLNAQEDIGDPHRSWSYCILMILLGGVTLHFGAEFMVKASMELAHRMGVSDALIGVTIVALGTSLPELAASIAAALKRHHDMCVGNIVGSNLFNILLIGGSVSAMGSLPVDSELLQIDFPAMMIVAAIIWLALATGRKLTRLEGGFLIIVYGVFVLMSSLFKLGYI